MKLKKCTRCELSETRTNVVIGRGNKKANILFIGEAPGKDEDESGMPFVGRAGKFLDSYIIEKLKLSEKDYYITNVVKCRPPNNRNPHLNEIFKCKLWLIMQIVAIRPKVIVCLGRISYEHITNFFNTTVRLKRSKIKIFKMLHPAAILYSRERIKQLDEQIMELDKILWEKSLKKK
jgi:uracil-DNA glycosylase